MSAWSGRVQWGVIDDARARRNRERRVILVVVALLAAVVVSVALAVGSASTRYFVPAPGRVSGSLRTLNAARVQYWVTPTLNPGAALLDVSAHDSGGWFACVGGCAGYVGAGAPVAEIQGGEWGGASVVVVRAPVSHRSQRDYLLVVPAGVAAIRVGNLGTASAVASPGLPSGDKLVAFQVPVGDGDGGPLSDPSQSLAVLNSRGYAVATVPAFVQTRAAMQSAAAIYRKQRALVTSRGGRCAVTTRLAGLTDDVPSSVTSINALAPTAPGLFLSCLEDKYAYRAAKFNVAILLNAHQPGHRPAAIWGAEAVAGQPDVVVVKPPPQFSPGEDVTSPLFARRVGNAWLVVQARPGFARNPGTAQTIEVLKSLHISRLALTKAS